MTFESATRSGKRISIPDDLVIGISRSRIDRSRGRVFIDGGVPPIVTKESFVELARMVVAAAETNTNAEGDGE